MEEELEEKIEVKEGTKITPLPVFPLAVLFIVRSIDLLALTSLFPYLSQMTVDLMNLDEKKDAKLVGYYSGFVAASYFIAQLFSSPFWGHLSDRIGRKPVMLLGTIGTGFTCLLFGFSKWFWWAMISRFLFGALNANLGVAKTYLREMCDDTNQSRAFSMVLNSSFSISIIIGPLIGGFLSRPYERLPFLFDNIFFRTFPYCLPNLFLAFLSFFGFTLAFFFMKESRFKKEEKKEEIESVEVEKIDEEQDLELKENEIENGDCDKLNNQNSTSDEEYVKDEQIKDENEEKSELIEPEKKNFCHRILSKIFSSPLLTMRPILNMLMYAIIGMQQIVFDEVLPIWFWTPTKNYGLGLEPYKIGIIQGIVGFFLIFFQLFVIPFIIERLSIIRTFQLSIIMSMPLFLGVVEISRFSELNLEWVMWVLLIIILLWKQVWQSMLFTTINLLVGNSVPKENLGVLFGIAQSSVALARTIGPSIAAPLFAMSISATHPYPFGVHFTFYLSGLILLMNLPLSFIDQK
eukprot:gene7666-12132_t